MKPKLRTDGICLKLSNEEKNSIKEKLDRLEFSISDYFRLMLKFMNFELSKSQIASIQSVLNERKKHEETTIVIRLTDNEKTILFRKLTSLSVSLKENISLTDFIFLMLYYPNTDIEINYKFPKGVIK